MKKTVTINISGIVYHIDEDAYQVLQGYLLTLENHFKNDSSSDEIMADIEARISELLQLKIKNPYQVISIEDVHEIIKIMGTPEDFGINSNQTEQKTYSHERNGYKRLFRDEDNRIIGGVCSGIAYYFNVDVVLIRILAIISFFFAGPLIYLIAWIIIPKATTTQEKVFMRGEKIDVESIKKKVREGFEDVKQDTRSFVQNSKIHNRVSTFFVELGGHLLRAVITISVLIFIALFFALFFGLSFQWIDFSNLFQIFPDTFQFLIHSIFSDATQLNIVVVGTILLISLPVLLVIWGILSLLFGFKKNSKLWGYLVFVIWFTGLLMLGFVMYKVVKDFDYKHAEKQEYTVSNKQTKEFIIYQSGISNLDDCTYLPNEIKKVKHWAFIECNDKVRTACKVELEVKNSLQDSITVEIFETASGKNSEDAVKRTKEIIINPKLTDSTLYLPKYIAINQNQQWRRQKVQVIVTLPKDLKYSVENADKLGCNK